MFKSIAILGFLFTAECLRADSAPNASKRPFRLEDAADVVIYYSPGNDDSMMEISIGHPKDNKPREVIRKENQFG